MQPCNPVAFFCPRRRQMRKSALESGVKILLFDGWGTRHRPRGIYFKYTHIHCTYNILQGTKGGEFLALKHESRILGYSSNPVCCFSMTEQVRLCAVWPMENMLGTSLNHIHGWMNDQYMLLVCFREKMPATMDESNGVQVRARSETCAS